MRKIISILLIISTSILTIGFSTFTPVVLLLLLPGLLFGGSITFPRLYPNIFSNYKKVFFIGVYIGLWIFSAILMNALQIISNSLNDKLPYIIIGVVSGIGIYITFEKQFGFKNKPIGLVSMITLSVIAALIFDYFYPNPHDKELNIGKQLMIWNILIILGLTVNSRD
jgi:hypothetical protein